LEFPVIKEQEKKRMVNTTGIIRKVDELGRVVLPIETRKLFGIEEKDSLEILVDKDNRQIILQKASNMCIKCQETENLKSSRTYAD
jgi:transcriptional pleiotropic regulator of transition state genes